MQSSRVYSAIGSSQCRHAALKLFNLNAAGLAIPTHASKPFLGIQAQSCIRYFSSGPISRFAPSDKSAETRQNEKDTGSEEISASETHESSTPWYLEVDPPRHVTSLMPPPLPRVPSDAPPLVDTVLTYASDEMGLDDLDLLDLREIHPASALGPNLFMLFGTARSERHLTVSAGRLVRWLRAKHRVIAHPDGLLGPNERKTKLRRKARRAKLLGTTPSDDADDGIRTGWICVSLGTLGRGAKESAVVAEDGRVAGFGVAETGYTIVVQIMTESRRAELDLESLWEKALPKPRDSPSESEPPNEDHLHPVERAIRAASRPQSTFKDRNSTRLGLNSSQNKARFYSTTRPTVQQPLADLTPDLRELLTTQSHEDLERGLKYDGLAKKQLLNLLSSHLRTYKKPIVGALTPVMDQISFPFMNQNSTPFTNQNSTPFMNLYELALYNLPPSQTWEHRVDLESKAREAGLPAFMTSLDKVHQLIQEMKDYGIEASRQQYLQLLSAIYCTSGPNLDTRSDLAADLLHTMEQRGQKVLDHDIAVTIIEALSPSREMIQSPSAKEDALIQRLEQTLLHANLPYMGDSLVLRLLESHTRRYDWDRFWDTWCIPPRHLRPRSQDMYARMYELATIPKRSKIRFIALRRCTHEMSRESPPVAVTGRVRDALLACISKMDRGAEAFARQLPEDYLSHQEIVNKLKGREFVHLAWLALKNQSP